MNEGRLTFGTRARNFGVPPIVHGLAEVSEGAGGNHRRYLGHEGVVLSLAGG